MNRQPRDDQRKEADLTARRPLLERSLGALGALALARGLGACASDTSGASEPGAPIPPPVGEQGASGSAARPGDLNPELGQTPAAQSAAASAQGPSAGAPGAISGAANRNMPIVSDLGASAQMMGTSPELSVPCDVVVPSFPSLADGGAGADFTRMDQSATFDWIVIGGATAELATKVPDGILNLLHALEPLHVGYPISMLSHSLQMATRAMQANASDDLVLCALCHDIGMAISVEGHAEISASILRGYVSESAYRVVRHHTEFEWQYGGAPSGQPTDQRLHYQDEPWYADAERFIDTWEQGSYDPSFAARPLTDFGDLVREKFGSRAAVSDRTATDCVEGSAT